jgi:CBS-domain-containing membrane protein
MNLTARDVMVEEFNTIDQHAPIEDAVRMIFQGETRETGYKTVSVIVTDKYGGLIGVVSMFDILYHLRPPVLNFMGDSIDFPEDELTAYITRFKGLTVAQVMSSPVRYVTPDTHLIVIVDRMVKEKCRRLPVVENAKVIGIVYLAEVFSHLCKYWLKIEFK